MKWTVALLALLAAIAIATTGANAAPAGNPHVLEFQYSQDYEGIGRHYTVGAIIKGDAARVSARLGSLRATARLSGHLSPGGAGKFWIIEDRDFISTLRDDLKADGAAIVDVRAVGAFGPVRKRCTLDFQPDPDFGDFADGPCKRVN